MAVLPLFVQRGQGAVTRLPQLLQMTVRCIPSGRTYRSAAPLFRSRRRACAGSPATGTACGSRPRLWRSRVGEFAARADRATAARRRCSLEHPLLDVLDVVAALLWRAGLAVARPPMHPHAEDAAVRHRRERLLTRASRPHASARGSSSGPARSRRSRRARSPALSGSTAWSTRLRSRRRPRR